MWMAVLLLAVMLVFTSCTSDEETAVTSSFSDDATTFAASGPVTLSMRPVFGAWPESPAVTHPESDHPAGLDPDTGLTIGEDPSLEAYLLGWDGFTVYHVGPAFVTEADIQSAATVFVEGPVRGDWMVVPELSEEGGERFREATGKLAKFPVADPRRQLVIVIDGEVMSAPAVAANIGPEGLDPDVIVITPPMGMSEQEAETLATRLNSS